MKFTDARKALDTIRAGDDVERVRSENRRRINDLFNGVPPVSKEDASKWNLKINVNWGEASVLNHHARRQYYNAFLKPSIYFRIRLVNGPVRESMDWETFITTAINRKMKANRTFYELYKSKFASVVSHGIGAWIWPTAEGWVPRLASIDKLRVPTDTRTALDNLVWFAERRNYTIGELSEVAFGKHARKGWKKGAVKKILKEYHQINWETDEQVDWENQPERSSEIYKQNGAFYSGDAVPTIRLWELYFLDEDDNKWKLRVIPDRETRGAEWDEFLFDNGDTPVAEDLSQILHIQFGDLSSTAPFLYHSVRSLGFLLMEPCFWTNLTRCRLMQHMFENFNTIFRSSDPNGRGRANSVELFDRAFIPEGIGIVPQSERHQIDGNLVQMVMSQTRQLMSEASMSYTQEIDSGTQKEQTAYETSVKQSTVNAMLTGLLATAFQYETYSHKEICRRFTIKDSSDKDVQEFQKECKDFGVPEEWLDASKWDLDPEVPIGAGNPIAEQTQIQQLMQARPMFSPTAQQEILHMFANVMTGDPKTAKRWVPTEGKPQISEAGRDAEFAFATLMNGVPVRVREELNIPDQVEVFIGLSAGVISRIVQSGGNAKMHEVIGIRTVEAHAKQLIQQLAQDTTQMPRVKQYMDSLGKLMNEVKGFEQRLQESQQSQMDPATQAKLQAMQMESQAKIKRDAMQAAAEQVRKDTAADAEQERKDAAAAAEIDRKDLIEMETQKPKA